MTGKRANQFRRVKPAAESSETGPVEAIDRASSTDETAAAAARPQTARELSDKLAEIRSERMALEDEIRRLEAFEDENILEATDDELDGAEQEMVHARRRIKRLDKMETWAIAQIKIAETDEVEVQRLVRYEVAERAVADGVKWIKEEYAAHAAAIAAGLGRLRAVIDQSKAVNNDLPNDKPPLDLEAFRILPAVRGSRTTVEEPYYVDSVGTALSETLHDKVRQDEHGRFWIEGIALTARKREKVVTEPGRPAASPQGLLDSVRLPRVLYEDPDFWNAHSRQWPG